MVLGDINKCDIILGGNNEVVFNFCWCPLLIYYTRDKLSAREHVVGQDVNFIVNLGRGETTFGCIVEKQYLFMYMYISSVYHELEN